MARSARHRPRALRHRPTAGCPRRVEDRSRSASFSRERNQFRSNRCSAFGKENTVTNNESRVVRILSSFVFVALGVAAALPSANRDLPFIENDYARSLSDARARKLPLAVEVHSLVCPACRTMAVTVLREPGITRHSPSFVWAKLDAGMLENAEFLNRFPVTGTPMFLIIEPETEKVLAKHVGLADEGELSELLEQSLKEFRGKRMDALH